MLVILDTSMAGRSIVDMGYQIRITIEGNRYKSPVRVNPELYPALCTLTHKETHITKSDIYLWEPQTPRWCDSCTRGDPVCGHSNIAYRYHVTCEVSVTDNTNGMTTRVHGVHLTTTIKCKCTDNCTHTNTPKGLGYMYRYTIV